MRYALFTLALLITFAPLTTHAAFEFTQIVPDACDCNNEKVVGAPAGTPPVQSAPAWGCVLQVLQNIIRVAIALGIAVATLALVYAGFVWMTSGGNPERRNQGSHLLINVFIGLAIMLGAWLIVDFIMKEIYNDETEFGPWNNILAPMGDSSAVCIEARQPRSIASGEVEIVSGGGVSSPVQGTEGCPTCVRLEGFQCKNNCNIDPAVGVRLNALRANFSGSWVVTEAYPPTSEHSNSCHYKGTCIDADFTGKTAYTAENLRAFSDAASRAGLRAVFEAESCSLRNTARTAGVTAYCKSDPGYGGITGDHFSVYSH